MASESRILSYSRPPMASRTAARAGPTALSTAGRSVSSSICIVRSLRGPVSSSSPMFCSVITLSAISRAYISVISAWRLMSRPCRHGTHHFGKIGSKIIAMPM